MRMDFASRGLLAGTWLLWLVIVPVLQLMLFWVVFALVLKARVPGLEGLGYVMFLALGMWPWFAFSEAVTRGASALVDNASLCNKAVIAPINLILARVVAAFAVHGVGFVVVLLLLSLVTTSVEWMRLPWLLLGWLMLIPAAAAFGVIAALITVFKRDFQQLLPLATTGVMFLSPILYSREVMPDWMSAWQWLNPVGLAIDSGRSAMLYEPEPWFLLGSLVGSMLAGGLAVLLYRRLRDAVVDYL